MGGAPALSVLLVTDRLQLALVVVLAILAALVVLAIVAALIVFQRRRSPEEGPGTVDSPVPPVPTALPPFPGGPVPGPMTQGHGEGAAPEEPASPASVPEPAPGERPVASVSPTQTPDDVDRRSPAELAAAAQAAEAAEERAAVTGNGDRPEAGGIQHEVAIGPPRPMPNPATPPDPARLRMLGLTLGMLTERMRREHPPQLGTALARMVDSDQEAARAQLSTLALSLVGEDEEPSGGDGQLSLFLEEALEGEIERGFSFSSMPEFQQALSAITPELREKLRTIVWARNADSVAILTTEDVDTLERVAVAMATAFMLETSYDVRRVPGQAPSRHS